MRTILLPTLLLIASAAVAQVPTGRMTFADLERWHARDRTNALARQRVQARIPPGSPLAAARQAIADAGGRCRTSSRQSGLDKCLIHQMSNANRSFDDIRWTIVLHSDGGHITRVGLSRYVDRKWTM